MSRKTRSGFSRGMAAMAERPSPHSATMLMSGSASSRQRRRPRARASSSLSNTRIGMIGRDLLTTGTTGAIGDADFDVASTSRRVLQHHGVVVVVELLESFAGVAQAHALARREATATGKADAVVADFHPNVVAVAPGGDAN